MVTVHVVTDDANQDSSLCAVVPALDVAQLYKVYLRSFKNASEGAVAW